MIAGLETLQHGTIRIAGVEVAGPKLHQPPERRPVGLVFQDYALFPHLNVRRNVTFGMDRGSRTEQRKAADGLLDQVGMADSADAMPHTLSGGQQQRVALARALAREPVVMLLDEPFSGLDERLRGEVRGTTLKVLRAAGVATLMITHDPREALQAGRRAQRLANRPHLADRVAEAVYHRPANLRVAEVFGPINRIPGTVRSGRVSAPWGELEAPEQDDGPVEILVRPAVVELSGEGEGVPGKITGLEPAGDLVNLTVALGDHALDVQDLTRRGWRVDDDVVVRVAPDAAVVRTGE